MKEARCDICWAQVGAPGALNELKACYQTHEIKEVCGTCLKKIYDQGRKINDCLLKPRDSILKIFIQNLRKLVRKGKE